MSSVISLSQLARGSSSRSGTIVAYPHHWQRPAATELAAYEGMLRKPPHTFTYWGIPWATIIDGISRGPQKAFEILSAVELNVRQQPRHKARRVTVCQHIHAVQHIDLFKAAGITDLFWPHATRQVTEVDGINLHPFPLYPAQAPELAIEQKIAHSKVHLANFIGSYNPKIYLSDVRQSIFDSADTEKDMLIVRRDTWHFDRTVYDEQLGGRGAEAQIRLDEDAQAEEYISAIRQSWFTLCPTGSGPNSIRIFESLALGSIPIILTTDLSLPGPLSLWEDAAIIVSDTTQGYQIALERVREMPEQDRVGMIEAGRRLFVRTGPEAYADLVHEVCCGIAPGNEKPGLGRRPEENSETKAHG